MNAPWRRGGENGKYGRYFATLQYPGLSMVASDTCRRL